MFVFILSPQRAVVCYKMQNDTENILCILAIVSVAPLLLIDLDGET